jgi:hypothetical protein
MYLERAKRKIAELTAELAAHKSSRIWKLTVPLRRLRLTPR